MPGLIPNPENILAMIAFEDQELVPASYAPNDVHRFVTRAAVLDGLHGSSRELTAAVGADLLAGADQLPVVEI